MVENLAPKISDVKSLKDLAQVFAIPMVVIAYFFQTGAQISFGENVFFKLNAGSSENQLLLLLLIFLMKALFSGWIAIFIYAILGLAHVFFR